MPRPSGAAKKSKADGQPTKDKTTPIARVATINLHKRLHGISFKQRAPRAVREIKRFAAKLMGTTDVRVAPDVNSQVWSHGIRNVPRRVRVKLSRKRNEEEDAKEKTYTLVEIEPGFQKPSDFQGTQTVKADSKSE